MSKILGKAWTDISLLKTKGLQADYILVPTSKKQELVESIGPTFYRDGKLLEADKLFDVTVVYTIGLDTIEVVTKGGKLT